jgi:hypothetical protein
MTATTQSGQPVAQVGAVAKSFRFRLLGLLPLAFFTAHFVFYWKAPFYAENRGVDNMLWMCNVGNLVLAIGILTLRPWLIRLAVIWLIPGLPLWLFEVVRNGGWLLTSFLTHIGGLAVGLVAIQRVRADKVSWLYALVWYVAAQILSRLLTSPYWNVNIAHRIYGGYEGVVDRYWHFWVITTLMVAGGLWILGFILFKLFPPSKEVG